MCFELKPLGLVSAICLWSPLHPPTSYSLRALGPARIAEPLPRVCSSSLASTRWASSLRHSSPIPEPVPRAGAHGESALTHN
ncbi:parathymosin-like [Pyrus ussuriensis x Pyrus communis]|uniref:Parathymosin-like n=1 Tax=Pyrus ussuriensis x Pyrus communis TaxID=2448454 RepID=A0A5N5HAU2_9ROSA|nr:parathymosin-like [Pyrus ussuriensis x Pyrus communis]